MTDTTDQAVVETPAPDANAETKVEATPDPSTGAVDTSDKSDKPNGSQKRIDELTWHRRNAERQNRQLQSELAELRAQLAGNARPQEQQRQEVAAAPKKLADFDYDEEKFAAHLVDVAAEKAAAKLREKADAERAESTDKDAMKAFRKREADFKKSVEDYDDVFESTRIDGHVAAHLKHMEAGPALVYYLGKNQEANEHLHSLPHNQVAIELGRIDARLAFEREQAKAKPVSKAPPPPPKIEASEGATRVSTTDPESDKAMSDDEWVKAERARLDRKKKRAAT